MTFQAHSHSFPFPQAQAFESIYEGNAVPKSCLPPSKKLTREPIDKFTDAVCRLPVKTVANITDVSDGTVKTWRAGAAPNLEKAARLARRVPAIKAAIIEILGIEQPETNRLIACCLSHLADIASGPDELSALKARKALEEFREMVAG